MGLLTLLSRRRDVVRSPLSPRACAEALSADIDGMLTPFGTKPVIGHVGPHGGSLRKRIRYNNAFQTTMSLSIQEAGGGSRIVARSFMSAFATIFMTFWFGIVGLVALGTLGVHGAGPAGLPELLLLLAFGVGLIAFSRWLARDEHDFLLAFVRKRVDGEIEAAASASVGAPIVS